MNRIKVLYIIDVFNKLAGSEKNLFEVVTMLDKNAFEPSVLSLLVGEAEGLLREKHIEVIDLHFGRIYSLPGMINAVKLYALMRSKKIDIVVTYHEGSDYLGGIVARLAGVPIIISSRRDMGYRLEKRHIVLYRFANKIFDRIVTVSDAVNNIVFDRENVPLHKLITIHNGADTRLYDKKMDVELIKKKLNIHSRGLVIGVLAGLRRIKGHTFFLEAAAVIVKEFPDACFLVAGPSDDEHYYTELQDLVKKLGISDNVLFSGEYSDNKELLAVVDISVISSLNEGFSNAVLESMAAGRPLVATNSGGTPEAIIDGLTGILVPPGDSSALAEGILRLMRDAGLRTAMGNAGRRRMVAHFDVKVMMAKIENLYMTLVKNKREAKDNPLIRGHSRVRAFLVHFIKTLLGGGLKYSGIAYVAKRTSGYLRILAFHRVVEERFDPLGMNISPEMFESQLRYIKKYYCPISLEQAVTHMAAGDDFPRDAIVLTFDDGYRNNFVHAFPLLKKYAVPATLFLSTNAVENNEMFWYDKIVNAIKKTPMSILHLSEIGLYDYRLDSWSLQYAAAQSIISALKYAPAQRRDESIAYIIKALGAETALQDFTTDVLSWKEIAEMRDSGIDLGSHAMSHSILTTLSLQEARREINDSKQLIEARTGAEVKYFAYPNGHPADFNESIVDLVKQCGYLGACTLVSDASNSGSAFTLNRYCVDSRMLGSFTGRFSGIRFEMEMIKQRMIRAQHDAEHGSSDSGACRS